MPSLLTIPSDPLARFRLLAIWFAAAIAFGNVGLFVLSPSVEQPFRLEGALAAGMLGVWWLAGYRRGRFPISGWLVDTLLMVLVAAWSPMPLHAIGLFYAGVQLRALYVPRQEFPLLPLSYAIARLVSIEIGPYDAAFGTFSGPAMVQVVGLAIIALTLHLFVEATRQHDRIEQELHHSEERYRLVAGAMHDVVYDWVPGSGVIEWTESMQHVFGFPPSVVGTDPAWWFGRVHPEDKERFERAAMTVLADPAINVSSVGYRVRRADDSYAHVSGTMVMQRDANGRAIRVIGSIRDVTTERQLEEQLRQSQKMEAVGQLAGGVAHDFNNLLTVIGGHVYLLERTLSRTDFTDRHLGGITRAAERAATLTKQLLAFSRKQLLKPSVVSMNAVVEDVLQMMRPVIGEHIQIVTRFDQQLRPIFADQGQLGQVLVNLALNARDAMPSGGTLTIETENVALDEPPGDASSGLPAGEYVRLSLRDTGSGMDAQTLGRAFEPFFTTKAKGLGSGLGLATVYGIVKQSAGDIRVASTVGEGTQFTILLPATKVVSAEHEARRSSGTFLQHRESRRGDILLVEDDEGVRDFAREVLVGAGYAVRTASNGVDALQQLEASEFPIDVVVTDVVMPEMGGRQLVEHLRRWRADLPVLYITGYTDDARMLGALYAADVRLLGKPFTARALVQAVEEVDDARAASNSEATL
ncbi:MAG: response regulator [Gemmatimonadota bacterium]